MSNFRMCGALALAAIIGLGLGSCQSTSKRPADKVKYVKIQEVGSTEYLSTLQYPGKVKAPTDASVAFKVSGAIEKIFVKEGQRIHKGQILAQMDQTDYQVQMDATEAEYLQIKAECERIMRLYEENSVSANDYDKAQYGLKQITAKYQHAKDQLEYTTLKAPFDGYVQERHFQEHEIVSAGLPVLSVISGGTPEVEISLPASEYIHKDLFGDITCSFDIYPGKTYRLEYVSCTPKANANQLYTMKLKLITDGNPVPSLGISTMVSIKVVHDNEDYLSVPYSALKEEPTGTIVWKVDPSSMTISKVSVKLERLLSNGQCVISSDGILRGDKIVTSGVHHVSQGERVEAYEKPSSTNVGGLM